jgi:hypothetical protein
MGMNHTILFDRLRSASPLGPTLSQDEVNGVNIILLAFQGAPTAWAAYALATAYHETAGTMLPIKERGSVSYFTRLYDVTGQDPTRAIKMGNTKPGDGPLYCGRGYVQLTWKKNYEIMSKKVGVDLVQQPDYALHPAMAAEIMDVGMTEGLFTGLSLDECIASDLATRYEFIAARIIINGHDDDVLIAGYALRLQDALVAAGWGE